MKTLVVFKPFIGLFRRRHRRRRGLRQPSLRTQHHVYTPHLYFVFAYGCIASLGRHCYRC